MGDNEQTIQSWIAKAQNGDTDCLGRLYEHFHQRIYGFIAYRVRRREEAEDLTQNVFLEMIRSLPRYRKRKNAKFSTWLFQIARYTLIDFYRASRPIAPLEKAEEIGAASLTTDPTEVTLDARHKLIRQKIKELPERLQTVLHLAYIEDFEIKEIAAVLKITALHTRVLKYRALKKLRHLLNK